MDNKRWHDPHHDRDFNERTNRDQIKHLRDECEVLRVNNKRLTARVAELEAAGQMMSKQKYPYWVNDSIVQYDEHVFVWLDETGNVGGAAPTELQARQELQAYASWLGPVQVEFEF